MKNLLVVRFVIVLFMMFTAAKSPRERFSINEDWRFYKYDSIAQADKLIYDVRPELKDNKDDRPTDAKPTEAVEVEMTQQALKSWILPTGNNFIKDPTKRHVRPEDDPVSSFPFVQGDFDDSSWESVDLPHDWAIKEPFYKGWNTEVGGVMGRLPSPGVAWYRKKLDIPAADAGKSIFLDVDGAMSYAMVWLNGHLVGGWPYGYASWRVDLTPYIVPGGENQLAIRLDNPPTSSRWYPGGGIYRNVWLTKTNPVHVGQWGTFVTTRDVSETSATIDLEVTIDNDSRNNADVEAVTQIFVLDADGNKTGGAVASFELLKTLVSAGESAKVKGSVTLKNPRLWGPPPAQSPNRYAAVTTLRQNDKVVDQYETRFGIRSLRSDPDTGIYVNGERIKIKGINQHHDLGALGAAFNTRAAERQLEILRDMGCNAIRTAHNPPAPELLELTDRMGFLVVDEVFDVWERKKTPLDFHLIFPDWHEQDLRALVRRDRNHPSVIIWSFGNEVGEQYTGEEGAAVAKRLHDIVKEEDPTRPTTTAMNWAKPDMPLPEVPDIISLNYQGEGIRQSPEFEGTNRIRTAPMYPSFHEKFPDKVILSSETASALSSRGIYLFPVVQKISDIVRDGRGGDSKIRHVSAYELHAVDFGSSADKVFGSIERHPYVAGEFVWTGWDYIGEPTPYYDSRSSYSGIIDLAGFKKDRFYIYQAHWRPKLPMAHILPHWNWPERVGEITPVHVFTSGDEAELFLNGKSLGRKKKGQYEYRLRWDDVVYEPGELKVAAFKDGKEWATDIMRTAGNASQVDLKPDHATISADGCDLSFVTLTVQDSNGIMVPRANNLIRFSVSGAGEIVATDNGDPTNLLPFSSHEREAFNGLCLVIVRGKSGQPGTIKLKAESNSLESATVTLQSVAEKANTGVAQHADSKERPKAKPGENPSAGPLPHLIDIWRAGAPAIDFLSPDIYFANFVEWCQKYHQSTNLLFIPEAARNPDCAANVFYAVGAHDAIGFSPFSIESIENPESAPITESYNLLSQLSPLILKHQGQGTMTGILLDKETPVKEITLGNYKLTVSHDYTWKYSSGPKDADSWPRAGGLIISTGPDEYVIAGTGLIITFAPTEQTKAKAGILRIEEGVYSEGKWIVDRRLNGDESHQGRHLRIPMGQFGIQQIQLYRYQ